jgi:hypothetical protein
MARRQIVPPHLPFAYRFVLAFADRFEPKIERSGDIPRHKCDCGAAISLTSPLPVVVET